MAGKGKAVASGSGSSSSEPVYECLFELEPVGDGVVTQRWDLRMPFRTLRFYLVDGRLSGICSISVGPNGKSSIYSEVIGHKPSDCDELDLDLDVGETVTHVKITYEAGTLVLANIYFETSNGKRCSFGEIKCRKTLIKKVDTLHGTFNGLCGYVSGGMIRTIGIWKDMNQFFC